MLFRNCVVRTLLDIYLFIPRHVVAHYNIYTYCMEISTNDWNA